LAVWLIDRTPSTGRGVALPIGGGTPQVRVRHDRAQLRESPRRSSESPRGIPHDNPPAGLPPPKFRVSCLELLKADDVGTRLSKPAEQVRQATDDIDVETGDFHRFGCGRAAWFRTSGAACQMPAVYSSAATWDQLLELLTRAAF
jgi:hypothetical protein